jgi:hypothetical protein
MSHTATQQYTRKSHLSAQKTGLLSASCVPRSPYKHVSPSPIPIPQASQREGRSFLPSRPPLPRHILNLTTPPHIPTPHPQPHSPPKPRPELFGHFPVSRFFLLTILVIVYLSPPLPIRRPQNIPIEIHPHARHDHALNCIVVAPRAAPFTVQGLQDEQNEKREREAEAQDLVRGADSEGGDGS